MMSGLVLRQCLLFHNADPVTRDFCQALSLLVRVAVQERLPKPYEQQQHQHKQ